MANNCARHMSETLRQGVVRRGSVAFAVMKERCSFYFKPQVAFLAFSLLTFLMSFCFGWVGDIELYAQGVGNGKGRGAFFVPSLDVDSPTAFSSIDAARRNRPPQPAKVREDLFYPDGFLTLSSPTPEPVKKSSNEIVLPSEQTEEEVKEPPVRPLDPSVETTPLVAPQYPTVPERKKHEYILFWVICIALIGLGIFFYYDVKYREQLRADLVENARLCSPKAVSSDFEEVLASGPELTDPLEPSLVNPTFDPDSLLYETAPVVYPAVSLDDEHFVARGVPARSLRSGVSLEEENFDFLPVGKKGESDEEVVGDFVVGSN